MPLVELRNVSKIYRLGEEEIRALDDVTLDIGEGEFISIIGPSGSGKSTLMHILGCLDSPSKGTIRLDGVMIEKASARQLAAIRNRKIGFVFQFFNLLPKLNVVQNVELPMIYSGVSGKERRQRAMASLEAVDRPIAPSTGPASFPAANSNAPRLRAPWSTARASSSLTSLPVTSTPTPATPSSASSASSARKAAPSCSSRTTPRSPP
jgi:ABC-type ATPase involved in cell division